MQPMRRALISIRVLKQIKLMILLSFIPLPSIHDLSDDLLPFVLEMFLLDFRCDRDSFVFLGGGVGEDGRTVLGACVCALTVDCSGIVGAIKEFYASTSSGGSW